MATSKAKISDSVTVEVNGEQQAEVKGPDPDRLANHAAERRAYANRLRRESESDK